MGSCTHSLDRNSATWGDIFPIFFQTNMLSSSLIKLSRASSRMLTQTRGMKGLPHYDPAAALQMKYAWVYMGVFMVFWGVAYIENPYRWRDVADKNYKVKWQGKSEE